MHTQRGRRKVAKHWQAGRRAGGRSSRSAAAGRFRDAAYRHRGHGVVRRLLGFNAKQMPSPKKESLIGVVEYGFRASAYGWELGFMNLKVILHTLMLKRER